MKTRKSARTTPGQTAWRTAVARWIWRMLVLYEVMEEKLD